MNFEAARREATLSEKFSLLSGANFWHTAPLKRFNVPSIRFSDGPNGIRGTKFLDSVPGACIPCGTGLGSTWNKSLLRDTGVLLSDECTAKGVHVFLGPTVNIPRSPLNGRCFETISEDPFLSGILSASIINGIQSKGTLAVVRHFVANDQEKEKNTVDVIVSDRAFREIYTKPFQLAIRHSNPASVMSSYSKVLGVSCSQDPKLLQNLLRDEWKWKGMVISDWFGTYSTEAALAAGLDLEMPGPGRFRTPAALQAMCQGPSGMKHIDAAFENMLTFVERASKKQVSPEEGTRDTPEDRLLNYKLASETLVLLKNKNHTLPLSADDGGDIAVIGPNARLAAAGGGGGSAAVRPYYTSSVYDGIAKYVAPEKIHYEVGAYGHLLLPLFNSSNITNEDGQAGVTIKFFNEPYAVLERQPFDQIALPDAAYQLMDYHHVSAEKTFYISMRFFFTPTQTGVYDFGLGVYGTADLLIDDELVIDNTTTAQESGRLFFGRGSTEKRAGYHMMAGTTYSLRVEAGNASTAKDPNPHPLIIPGGACRLGGCLHIDRDESIQRAVDLAKRCKHTILVVGLNGDHEKEGVDRQHMDLNPDINSLVTAVLAAVPSVIIVTQAGSPFTMPWAASAQTILHSWYGGNEAGNAVSGALFGAFSPSGKLPLTWPKRIQDSPSYLSFGSDNGNLLYAEDIFVGYRGFEARNIEPEFAFGHGLSYTTFSLSSFELPRLIPTSATSTPAVSTTSLSVAITNTGATAGSEVLQLFVSRLTPSVFFRPPRELKGFEKVFLQPGESEEVVFEIDRETLGVWDEKFRGAYGEVGAWRVEKGVYIVEIYAGSHSVREEIEVQEDIWEREL